MLVVDKISVYYGSIRALHDVSLFVDQGETVALIGANGAGKSTLLWTVMGVLRPSRGRILFEKRPVKPAPDYMASLGISLVPERRRLFSNLTVRENLLVGAYRRRWDREIQNDMEFVFSLFPVLKDRLSQYAGTLSGGEQQMLAIGRSLMAKPRLLLLDEPSLGLAPALVTQLFKVIKQINSQGTAILLAEQNAFEALETAHRAYVLETGRITLSGEASKVLHDPGVQASYLGVRKT